LGIPVATLRGALPDNVADDAASLALQRLVDNNRLALREKVACLPGFEPRIDDSTSAVLERIRREALDAGLEPANLRNWAEGLGLEIDRLRELLAYLERQHELVRSPGDFWFSGSAIEALRMRVIEYLEQNGEMDTQTYKDLIGTSRRTAMRLMELLDDLHVTRRDGDIRRLRQTG
jgi:selenocysteine-specific elongation factor